MKLSVSTLLILLLLSQAAPGQPGAPAPADTSATRWGSLPAAADSTTARFEQPAPPAWQTALLVPYHIVGVPLTMVDGIAKGTLVGLQKLGVFATTTAVVRGIPDPLGNFWLPDGSIGDAKGLEFGIIGQRPDFPLPGWRTKGAVSTSTRRATTWSLGAITDLGRESWFELGGGSRQVAQANFYGTGVGTTKDDRAVYRRDVDWFGLGWRQELRSGWELVMIGHYSVADARRSRYEVEDDIESVFAGDLPYGYGQSSSGITPGLQLGYDSTLETARPAQGERLLGFFQYYLSTDGNEEGYWTHGLSFEKFLGLGRPQRTLAVKAWWLRQYGLGDNPIPFTRLLRNRGPYQLRGYNSTRFHATGSAGATVEYRWPVWMLNEPENGGVDAYVFGDLGQPFDHLDELAAHDLFWSAGGGLRIINRRRDFTLRIELAGGREGLQARLTTSQLFQFIKAGFHGGSEPIPFMR